MALHIDTLYINKYIYLDFLSNFTSLLKLESDTFILISMQIHISNWATSTYVRYIQ